MSRFYRRTFAEFDPPNMLVRPDWSEETDDAVHFHIPMCQMIDEDIKISIEKNKTMTLIGEGDGVFAAERGFKKYVCYIDLPDIDSRVKYYTTPGIKADMMYHTGMVELIIPKLKQHEKQDDHDDDDQRNTFNLTVNRTFGGDQDYCYHEDDDNDYQDEDDHNYKRALSSVYAYMGSFIKVLRLPLIINKCVNISSQLFLSTLNDEQHRRLNVAVNSISNFIYTNIMNRFGLFPERVYSMSVKSIEPLLQETDEFLYCYYNSLRIEGAVYDEFKATHHMNICKIKLQPEDGYYSKYNMRDIKADFRQRDEGGELKLTIPKFDAAQRMMNDKKNEAGEFSKLNLSRFAIAFNRLIKLLIMFD